MDGRLITAIAAGIAACCLAGAVAFAVMSDTSGVPQKARAKSALSGPAPMLLAERGAGSLGAADAGASPVLDQRGSLRLASLTPPDADTGSRQPTAAPPVRVATAPSPAKSQPDTPSGDIRVSPLKPDMTGVLTPGAIARIKVNLKLSPDQELLWPPVQSALAEMGRQQMALAMRGQKPEISQADWPPQKLYFIAGPLIRSLRPEQKDQVRNLCRSMGFVAVASML